jgi:NitT/TauT family transport system substrate-binding protein
VECVTGDPRPAFELILAKSPEQSYELSTFKIAQIKRLNLVDGGDAAKLGIGAMTDERWKSLFDIMSAGGVYAKDLDYRKAYTGQFVNRKAGQ